MEKPDNGRAFKAKFRQRMRQRQPRHDDEAPKQQRQQYGHLYKRSQQANILNVLSVISEEVPPNRTIAIYPRLSLDDCPVIGRGATFEVLTKRWQKGGRSRLVAVKRIRRDHAPRRNGDLALHDDYVYLRERDVFYSKVEDMLQELKIMTNEPFARHRNIVRLLDLAWDSIDDSLFAPMMIVELACPETPTLKDYFESTASTAPPCLETISEFIADVADGLTALHFSNVLHSDLKPSNVLLFREGSSLVAKISDFGYADADRMVRKEDSDVRGGTREWAAPELLSGCPEAVRSLSRVAPTVSDVYSFGLLVFYISSGGLSPLRLGGWSMDALDEVKFRGSMFAELEKHASLQSSDAAARLFDNTRFVSAVRDSLRLDPTKRLATLGGIRCALFETSICKAKDGGQVQGTPVCQLPVSLARKCAPSILDKGLADDQPQPLSSLAQPNIALNKVALNTLPTKLRAHVQSMLGTKAGLFEPMAHSVRRGQFFPEAQSKTLDTDLRLSMDKVQFLPSFIREMFAISKVTFSMTFGNESSVADLLQTECTQRPSLFTLIDGNNVDAIRRALLDDPSQATTPLSMDSGGWYPLHLAAEQGRVEIVRLLLGMDGVDCDVRSGRHQLTPLHQATHSGEPAVVELLLDSGAQIDARYYVPNSGYIRDMTALDLAVEGFDVNRGGLKKRMDIIRLLLRRGADYLHNHGGRGYSVVFRAAKNLDLLKVFFDTIPPEEARLLVTIIDDLGSTLLAFAASVRHVDTVRYLLSKGADPRVRDRLGRTISIRLESDAVFKGSVLGMGDEAMPYLVGTTQRQWDQGTAQILAMLRAAGGQDAMALDDFCFSSEETHEILERARVRNAKPFAARIEDAIASGVFSRRWPHMMALSVALIPRLAEFQSRGIEAVANELKQQLLKWQDLRQAGVIPMDVLPREWQRALSLIGTAAPGLWEEVFVKEDLPQLAEWLHLTLVSWLDTFFHYDGFKVIQQLGDLLVELDTRGVGDAFFSEIYAVGKAVVSLRRNGPDSILRKSVLAMHVKKLWRVLMTGEAPDHIFQILSTLGLQNLVNDALLQLPVVLEAGEVAPLASTIHTLRLPQRYPGTQMFVTGTSLNLWPVKMLIALGQALLFSLPAVVYIAQHMLALHQYSSAIALIVLAMWRMERPGHWALFDQCRLHPNVLRGLKAASSFLYFRLRHPWAIEEPVIISVPPRAESIDVTSAMHCIPAGRSNVLRLLSISHDCQLEPIPCYAAMGELMDCWKNGTLPRKGWCNGWWELTDSDEWARVNASGKPSFDHYTEASKRIKDMLCTRKREAVYEEFLRARDYWLDTPAEQLSKMKTVFGEEHHECFQIWADLFLGEPVVRDRGFYKPMPAVHNFLQSLADFSWYVKA